MFQATVYFKSDKTPLIVEGETRFEILSEIFSKVDHTDIDMIEFLVGDEIGYVDDMVISK